MSEKDKNNIFEEDKNSMSEENKQILKECLKEYQETKKNSSIIIIIQ